jgi:hypothetical protein
MPTSGTFPAPPAGASNSELVDYNVAPNAGSYTPTQLADIDYTGGFHDLAGLEQIIAIQQAETSGTPGDIVTGVGQGDYEYSVGMSAVNISSAPQQTGSPDLAPGLLLPITNAIAAYGISGGGQSWGAWSTYNEGAANITPQDVAAAESAINSPAQASLTANTLQSQFLADISYDIPASPNLGQGVSLATLTANGPITPAQVGGGTTGQQSQGTGPTTSTTSPGTAASNSSLYKALQSVNGWLNPVGSTPTPSTGLPGSVSDILNLLTFGTAGLAQTTASAITAAAKNVPSGPVGWLEILEAPAKLLLARAVFALPGIIVLLGSVGITVLGIGASGPAKNVLEVVDLGKAAAGKLGTVKTK